MKKKNIVLQSIINEKGIKQTKKWDLKANVEEKNEKLKIDFSIENDLYKYFLINKEKLVVFKNTNKILSLNKLGNSKACFFIDKNKKIKVNIIVEEFIIKENIMRFKYSLYEKDKFIYNITLNLEIKN